MTLVTAIDVSSHQPNDLTAIIATHKPDHVIVRLYIPGEKPSPKGSIAQVNSAYKNGCTVGGYLWAYKSFDPRKSVRDALELAALCEVKLPILWIDCETYNTTETGPDNIWLMNALDECTRHDIQGGIYTGGWWWEKYMGNTAAFGGVPLWFADYDQVPDPAVVTQNHGALFGGWTKAAGKQYSTSGGIDQSVFYEEYTRTAAPIQAYLVGPGIHAAMLAQHDTPASNETYDASWARGTSGRRYVYVPADNRTYTTEPVS